MPDEKRAKANRDVQILLETDHLRVVRRAGWEYVERRNICGIVVIVALTPDHEVVLVEQFRTPMDANVIELPAGLADVVGGRSEILEEAARRELLEETGYRADSIVRMFHGPPSAGITSEDLTFFLATRVERVGEGGGDAHENIRVHTIPLEEVDSWLEKQSASGRQVDIKVYAGLYAVRRY
ncbi:MAG: NUDIX hydrolase [Planctomycetes bacterium]|jgi:ADP-ribose pyrophosphatase|nr:NUDIX hydrolase [Planctomycetota bacterium]